MNFTIFVFTPLNKSSKMLIDKIWEVER